MKIAIKKANKIIVTLSLVMILSIYNDTYAQIAGPATAPTGMTIQNPSNSSNSYYSVGLTVNEDNGRAAGGMSVGLDGSWSERYYLFYLHSNDDVYDGKFRINYGGTDIMTYTPEGRVGIGTNDPQNKLSVDGTIWATKVKCSLTDAADWVFEEDYELRSLNEVEDFIKENKHLPEIPSAEEFRQNDLDIAEMDNKLLQKIEELTLYLIDQNKEIEAMKKEIQQLKNQ